jgi:hypothetical protein
MKRNFDAIIVFLLSGIIFFLFFLWVIPEGIFNFNQYFFSTDHDGIKNYYTFLYYLKYNSGFHFSGMAYPFGDLITFTDNQPLLVLTIKLFKNWGFDFTNNAVAIFNSLLIIGLPLTVLFIFKILRHYQVSVVYSFLIALSLTFLNPQIERFAGHYALAYSFVIPLFWWFDIKIEHTKNKWLWLTLAVLSILALTFLHVYYLAVALIFYFFAGVANVLLSNYSKTSILNIAKVYLPLSLLPIVVFKLFMFFIDNVNDRVTLPYGFTTYRATYASIFFNEKSPFHNFSSEFLMVGKYDFEGHAYLGFYALLFTGILFYLFFAKIHNAKKWNIEWFNITQIDSFKKYIILAFLAYCVAAAFPFYMPPFDILVEYLTPLAQFRSPGRFAWILFYLFNVFFFIYLFKMHQTDITWKKYLLPIILVLTFFEGVTIAYKTFFELNKTTLAQQYFENDLELCIHKKQINTSKYQAIIAFPFFTIGNEKAGYAGSNQSVFNAMKLSYKSGLPMVNYMMSRTGINTGLTIAQFTANSFLPKLYLNEVDSNKPFLLLVNKTDELSQAEKDMVMVADSIYKVNNLVFYSLSVSQIKFLQTQKLNALKAKHWHANNYLSNVFCADSLGSYFYLNQNIDVNELFNNNDALMNKNGEEIVFESKIPIKDSLIVSYWGRSKNSIYGFPNLKLDEFDANGKQVFHYDAHLTKNFEFYCCTRRINYTFKPQNDNNIIKITISGKKYNYSNLVIQKANSEFIFKDKNGNWFWNNYPSKVALNN